MAEDTSRPPDPKIVQRVVEAALLEDGARSDVTTKAVVPDGEVGRAAIIAKEGGVLAGLPVAEAVFAALDATVRFAPLVPDGSVICPGDRLVEIEGALSPILSGERVALNFLQQLSGVATATHDLVEAVAGLNVRSDGQGPARIIDTRKTTPGLRELERYAVRLGGGQNHRFNLSDGVLIKDNHIAAARDRDLTIAQIVELARRNVAHTFRVEIEVTTREEAREALGAGADAILLDNMSVADMRHVVEDVGGRAITEASGGVTIDTVREIAETGVDLISVGGITHSAPALDLSLELET
ncbi:MAG: carboxylating nicotinate-nucleotide diphosphorylase [Chloroflexi bacterium]|nr:carboxylating nicotinate-nucleotide diphosphorylase [Chloroflexota bacterium]